MVDSVKKSGIPIALHRRQAEFLNSTALKKGYVGGRGSGKSHVGSLDMIKWAKKDRLYMIAAPTYPMLNDATFRSFIDVASTTQRLIRAKHGSDLWCSIRTFDANAIPSQGVAEILFRTASDPEKLRGPNLSGIWLDEASLMVKEALDISMACLREGGDIGTIRMTFTPKGRQHWTYDEFYCHAELTSPGICSKCGPLTNLNYNAKDGHLKPYCELFQSHQKENIYLHKQYIAMMEAQYGLGSKMGRQELEGNFIDIEGLMFQREWFPKVQYVPLGARRIRYWDKAGTQDGGCYSVGSLVAKEGRSTRQYIVEDIVRGQWSYAKRNEIIKQTAEKDLERYGNLITTWIEQEPGSGGQESALISVKDLAGHAVYLDRAQVAKAERAVALASQAEIGNVAILSAVWNDTWLEEIQAFPESNFKDQVDATVGAFNKLALGGFRVDTVESIMTYPLSPEKQRAENERLHLQETQRQLAIDGKPINNGPPHDRPHDRTGKSSSLLTYLTRPRRSEN